MPIRSRRTLPTITRMVSAMIDLSHHLSEHRHREGHEGHPPCSGRRRTEGTEFVPGVGWCTPPPNFLTPLSVFCPNLLIFLFSMTDAVPQQVVLGRSALPTGASAGS